MLEEQAGRGPAPSFSRIPPIPLCPILTVPERAHTHARGCTLRQSSTGIRSLIFMPLYVTFT